MLLRIVIIFGIVALNGCDDSGLEPIHSRLAGRYVLESVNRSSLPAIDADNEYVRRTILADTLDFIDPGIAESSVAVRVLEKRTDQTTTIIGSATQAYRIRDYDRGSIVFEFICPDNAMCTGPFIGRLSRDGGTLTTGLNGAQTYRYRRI